MALGFTDCWQAGAPFSSNVSRECPCRLVNFTHIPQFRFIVAIEFDYVDKKHDYKDYASIIGILKNRKTSGSAMQSKTEIINLYVI